MSDDAYGDTDRDDRAQDQVGKDTAAGDGLPGVPVDGLPGWRAGVFGSNGGMLGMARVSELVARPQGGAAAYGPGGLQPTRVSDPVLDWEQDSWRWNDPEAIAFDLAGC